MLPLLQELHHLPSRTLPHLQRLWPLQRSLPSPRLLLPSGLLLVLVLRLLLMLLQSKLLLLL
jgi:hypothetical protein